MADCNKYCPDTNFREAVCIHTDKVYDSCRDKDCLENIRVYLTGCAQAVVDKAINVKFTKAEVIWVFSDIDTQKYNKITKILYGYQHSWTCTNNMGLHIIIIKISISSKFVEFWTFFLCENLRGDRLWQCFLCFYITESIFIFSVNFVQPHGTVNCTQKIRYNYSKNRQKN